MESETMNTETTVPTGEETQNPPPEAVEPEVTAPDAESTEESKPATPEPEISEAEKSIRRMQRRIDKRTADFHRERAEREMLAQKVAELEARLTQEPKEERSIPVDQIVEERVKIKAFTDTANRIVETGRSENPDFMEAIKDLSSEVGDFVKPNGAPSPFMEVVLDVSDNPAKLMYHLGKNPEVASELAELRPYKLAAKLKEIEKSLVAPKPKPSAAPKPLEPVKGSANATKDPSEMSDKEFAAWRRAQIAARH